MKVYISGKISGLPIEDVRAKFDKAKQWLLSRGYEPVSPLDNECSSECWYDQMNACFAQLKHCQAIYLLADWKASPGAICEYHSALRSGKQMIFEQPFKPTK